MSGHQELTPVRTCDRAFTLDDLTIRSDGSGRIVEAYAAVFNDRTEVRDQDGHYHEELSPVSFTRTIQHKGTSFGVLFNHGRTIDGGPNPAGTMPIGVPLEVHPDERGVFTATRYLDNPLADQVLDAIKNGAIRAQSFSGKFRKSVRSYPSGRGKGALPLITRMEIEMREYGPAVFATYDNATILGVRSVETFVRALMAQPPDERLAFLTQFEGITTPATGPESLTLGTPDGPADPTDDAHPRVHSARPTAQRIRAARIRLNM